MEKKMIERLLNTKQASEMLGVDSKSLANSRYSGQGIAIPFVKMGRLVRYKQSDIENFIEKNTFQHTSETKKD